MSTIHINQTTVQTFTEVDDWGRENPDHTTDFRRMLTAAVQLGHVSVNFAVAGQHFLYHRGAIGARPSVRKSDADEGRHWTEDGTLVEWADDNGDFHQGTSTGLYGACVGLDAHHQVITEDGQLLWVRVPLPIR